MVPLFECPRVRELRKTAAATNLRAQRLLVECPRLAVTNFFPPKTVLDLILRTLDARRSAWVALSEHAALHGCSTVKCNWPSPDCGGCKLSLSPGGE